MSAENGGLGYCVGELISSGMVFAWFTDLREQFTCHWITVKIKLAFSGKWRNSPSLSSCGVFFGLRIPDDIQKNQ